MAAAEEAVAKHQRGCFDKTGFILYRTRKKFSLFITHCVSLWRCVGGKRWTDRDECRRRRRANGKGGREAKTGGQQMDINRFSRQWNHKYVTGKGFCFSNDFLFLRKELLLKALSGEKKRSP
jgi:hypothetical protein